MSCIQFYDPRTQWVGRMCPYWFNLTAKQAWPQDYAKYLRMT